MYLYWFQRDAEVYQETKNPLLPLHHLYTLHNEIIQIYSEQSNRNKKLKKKKRN